METLLQKRTLVRREVMIKEDALLIHQKNFKENVEFRLKYEYLGFDTVRRKTKEGYIYFYGCLLMCMIYAECFRESFYDNSSIFEKIFWLLFSLSSLGASVYFYRNRIKDLIYLTGGDKILELYATVPNAETVEAFIDKVHAAMRAYYVRKYFEFEADTPFDVRMNQLKWLKDIEALDENTYKNMVEQISKKGNSIGFQRDEA